jgi:hypothetical protein
MHFSATTNTIHISAPIGTLSNRDKIMIMYTLLAEFSPDYTMEETYLAYQNAAEIILKRFNEFWDKMEPPGSNGGGCRVVCQP